MIKNKNKKVSIKSRVAQTVGEIFLGLFLLLILLLSLSLILTKIGQVSPAGQTTFSLGNNANLQEIKNKMATEPYDYAVFDRESHQLLTGRYQASDLDSFKSSFESSHNLSEGFVHFQYLQNSRLSLIVRQSEIPEFTNPALRKISFNQFSYFFLILGMLAVIFISVTRLIREFSRNFRDIQVISQQMGEIQASQKNESKISEFSDILSRLYQKSDELAGLIAAERLEKQDLSFQIAALAHDVKTPLTVLQGNIELLELSELSSQQEDYIQSMKHSLTVFERYFSSMIDYSRLLEEDGRENVVLEDFMDELKVEFKTIAETYQIDFRSEIYVSDISFEVNKQGLMRALTNIFVNACQYADSNDKQVKLSICEESDQLIFAFWNNGRPISDSALENAGKLFFTEDKGRSGKHYGIGLSFAEAFALKHGGKLLLENPSSGGAKVNLMIKIKR